MSMWTYINGTVTVSPMGRTQAEKRYILDTILDHLPLVIGSEENMNVYVIQKNGYNCSSSSDEFGYETNNLVDNYGRKGCRNGWLRTQDEYILVVDGSLRDRKFDETLKEFNKWLCRLSKRVFVEDILVKIKGYKQKIIIDDYHKYWNMFEFEDNWCDYLMWKNDKEEER